MTACSQVQTVTIVRWCNTKLKKGQEMFSWPFLLSPIFFSDAVHIHDQFDLLARADRTDAVVPLTDVRHAHLVL